MEKQNEQGFVEKAFGVTNERHSQICAVYFRALFKRFGNGEEKWARSEVLKEALKECKDENERLSLASYEGFVEAKTSNGIFSPSPFTLAKEFLPEDEVQAAIDRLEKEVLEMLSKRNVPERLADEA